MTIKAIGGLPVAALTELEKEIAAKAIEAGYLRKVGDLLEPQIIVIAKKDSEAFDELSTALTVHMQELADKIADELAAFMKKQIPAHLQNEYQIYASLIACVRLLNKAIGECISSGLLNEPQKRIGAEGVLMVVEK